MRAYLGKSVLGLVCSQRAEDSVEDVVAAELQAFERLPRCRLLTHVQVAGAVVDEHLVPRVKVLNQIHHLEINQCMRV